MQPKTKCTRKADVLTCDDSVQADAFTCDDSVQADAFTCDDSVQRDYDSRERPADELVKALVLHYGL